MSYAIYSLDRTGVVTAWNSGAERLYGYGADDILGQHYSLFFTPEDQANEKPAKALAIAWADGGFTDESSRVREDGTQFWASVVALPILDEYGEFVSFAEIAHELTMRPATRANLAKSRFLAGMSHDLRTTLHTILGYAQLLTLEGELTTVQSARVGDMICAGTDLLKMIDSVLDMSAIEAGRVEMRPVAFDPRIIATTCLEMVRHAALEKGLALRLVIEENVPDRVVGDSTRLQQILINLLGNAVKFTDRGSVKLGVSRAAERERLKLEVADTGTCISGERRADLFHEFERLDRNVNNNVEGTGSGLAISVRLAAMMGGYLGHADNPAGGNVFWLELPLDAGTADEAQNGMPAPSSVDLLKTAHTDTAAQTAAASLAARVLVVDDMVTNRDIARAFLRVAGYQVDCVENGEKAIAAVAAKDYDVVLMDVHLPGMDGMEASRRIRALTGARGQVPIIALTARVLAQQVEECRKAGMDSYLGKPFAPARLLEAVAFAVNAHEDNSIVTTTHGASYGLARKRAAQQPTPSECCDPIVSNEAPPGLDRKKLTNLLDLLGCKHLASLLGMFQQQIGSGLLKEPCDEDDRAALERQMHKLFSTAGTLGFVALSSSCRRLEQRLGSGTSISSAFEEVVSEMERARLELESLIPKMAKLSYSASSSISLTDRPIC